jgi:hypothetical protein
LDPPVSLSLSPFLPLPYLPPSLSLPPLSLTPPCRRCALCELDELYELDYKCGIHSQNGRTARAVGIFFGYELYELIYEHVINGGFYYSTAEIKFVTNDPLSQYKKIFVITNDLRLDHSRCSLSGGFPAAMSWQESSGLNPAGRAPVGYLRTVE